MFTSSGSWGNAAALRERIARLLGCAAQNVALTGSATDGINAALHALGLGPGDEVDHDEEHSGRTAPLGRAQARGVDVRVVPWDELAGESGRATKLIACSHVSWVTGRVADNASGLKATGVPILYDGAQGLGAIPVDAAELGCDFYAAAGQKWLWGPTAAATCTCAAIARSSTRRGRAT